MHRFAPSLPRLARRRPSRPLALCLALAPGAVAAETWTLDALEDFPVTDAGEVPYYPEPARGTLAIDAAIVEYRDRFARATAPHPGPDGTYHLLLRTVAEVDGETPYRLLVDGEVVGTAVNEPVDEEFAVREIRFEGVEIPAGAELGVESAAVSNDLVPEGDGFAFARGRWLSLALSDDGPVEIDPEAVALSVSVEGPAGDVHVGDRPTIEVGVVNRSEGTVATAPALAIALPASLAFVSGEGCTAVDGGARCELAEIAPGASAAVAVELDATAPGAVAVTATVSADQPGAVPGDEVGSIELEILPADGMGDAGGTVPPTQGEAPATGDPVTDEGTGEEEDRPRSSSGGGAAWLLTLLAAGALAGRSARPRGAGLRPSPSAPCDRIGRSRRSRAGS